MGAPELLNFSLVAENDF